MSDDEVGYGKPPRHTRFKKGASANPKGRPKRISPEVGEVIKNVLDARVEYREGGQTKKAARRELTLKRHLSRALKGDIGSMEALLKLRAQAQVKRDATTQVVQICDLLPSDAPHPKSSDADPTDQEA